MIVVRTVLTSRKKKKYIVIYSDSINILWSERPNSFEKSRAGGFYEANGIDYRRVVSSVRFPRHSSNNVFTTFCFAERVLVFFFFKQFNNFLERRILYRCVWSILTKKFWFFYHYPVALTSIALPPNTGPNGFIIFTSTI